MEQKPYKVLVWGDSIGRQNETPWPTVLQQHFQVSCYTGRKMEVVNIAQCGLAGVNGQYKFEEEVKPEQPDLVIIQFGFNDLRHDENYGAHAIGNPDQYEQAMVNMIRNAKSIGAEVLVLGNHNFRFGSLRLYPTGLNGDETVEIYRRRAEHAANTEGAGYINMADALAEQDLTPLTATCDGCHLSPYGVNVYAMTVARYILEKQLMQA
ncbi:MAG: SGNH/GDSL hydrolase family protein [Lentisphaeria bacterium]|nr:SGNH/GDSL hydrolase family protein [Lentisphaeria bacterium]